MAGTRPPLLPLHKLTPGQPADCFAVLLEKARGQTQQSKPFFTCRFADRQRTVTAMIWADTPLFEKCEQEWKAGHFYKLRGVYQEHEKYGPQFEVQQIREARGEDREAGFDPSALLEHSRYDVGTMWADLLELVDKEIADPPLRRLVQGILESNAQAFQRLPATQSRFYPFVGGLLEHTLSVAQSCLLLASHYENAYPELRPPLNRDVLIAAAVLHDVGRVLELEDDAGGKEATVPGRLVGHVILGRDVVRDAAKVQGDVHPERLQLLEHLILTHLALPEWGSPRLPLVPEALILHHADDLDAKVEMFARCLSRDRAPGAFTDRDPGLGRQLLKGRTL